MKKQLTSLPLSVLTTFTIGCQIPVGHSKFIEMEFTKPANHEIVAVKAIKINEDHWDLQIICQGWTNFREDEKTKFLLIPHNQPVDLWNYPLGLKALETINDFGLYLVMPDPPEIQLLIKKIEAMISKVGKEGYVPMTAVNEEAFGEILHHPHYGMLDGHAISNPMFHRIFQYLFEQGIARTDEDNGFLLTIIPPKTKADKEKREQLLKSGNTDYRVWLLGQINLGTVAPTGMLPQEDDNTIPFPIPTQMGQA